MLKLNNYFTTNQTLTLQNFTWGGVYNTYLNPLFNKEFVNIFIYKINNKNMIKFTVYL